ncbi:HPr family phosphocarrier protein [Streptomyces sp. CA-249302]|uniref:HPr family phosphocarrier protein n=1 Tax=Streptomyces sp. CA-249302 TaxID=3240058 RepID=UPI003D940719
MSASSDTTPGTCHEAQVVLPANLHARPAGRLARAAGGFTSTIELTHNGRTINPTGVLGVMGLGATAGNSVTVRATGPDAREAVAALTDILANAE